MKPRDYLTANHAESWDLRDWWRFFNQSRFSNLELNEVRRMTRGVMQGRSHD